jgi:tetratricopeptide (TPR) repeat protein
MMTDGLRSTSELEWDVVGTGDEEAPQPPKFGGLLTGDEEVAQPPKFGGLLTEQMEAFAGTASIPVKSAIALPWTERGVSLEEVLLSLEAGQTLCQQKRWDEMMALYGEAIQLFEPVMAIAYRQLGWAQQEKGDLAAAEQLYRKAVAIQPESAEVHARLGSLYAGQQRWPEAIGCYQQAIALDPHFAGAYLKLGEVWRQLGDVTQAAEQFHQAFQLNPDLFSAAEHWQLGNTLREQQDWGAAIASYRMAIALDPEQVEVWLSLAETLKLDGQVDAAIECYRQAIEYQPDWATPYTYLGNLLTQQGRPQEAVELHRQAIALKGWQQAATRNYRFTYDWFTHNLLHWQDCLAVYAHQPDLQFLEIGSYEGMSTCWLLDHILTADSARLTTIDTEYAAHFDDNIAATTAIEKITKLVGNSHQLLPTLAIAAWDVIYIDGCHLAAHVQRDASLAWPLLKPGGLMIFDDYVWHDPNFPDDDPRLGIDLFLTSLQEQFGPVHQSYQLIIQKMIPSASVV